MPTNPTDRDRELVKEHFNVLTDQGGEYVEAGMRPVLAFARAVRVDALEWVLVHTPPIHFYSVKIWDEIRRLKETDR